MSALLLALAILGSSQGKPAIRAEKNYPPYKLVRLVAENVPAKSGVIWRVRPSKGVDRSSQPDKTKLEFVAPPGSYEVEILVVTVGGDGSVTIDEKQVDVTIGDAPPPTPPGPTPPGPTPPQPDNPAPIPADGFRVLVIYESAELAKLPAAQQSVLFSRKVRDYLDAKCIQDGSNKAWRVWDKDTDTAGESRLWQDAMKRERKSIPWIIISNGKTGYEGPLPENADKTIDLLKKFGGA